jgi:hypothetical protein
VAALPRPRSKPGRCRPTRLIPAQSPRLLRTGRRCRCIPLRGRRYRCAPLCIPGRRRPFRSVHVWHFESLWSTALRSLEHTRPPAPSIHVWHVEFLIVNEVFAHAPFRPIRPPSFSLRGAKQNHVNLSFREAPGLVREVVSMARWSPLSALQFCFEGT